MPEFQYTARDRTGVSQQGAITATSRSAAATLLRDRGWIVLKVDSQEVAEESTATRVNFSNRFPVRPVHVELTIRQLAMMLRSGMTILESIKAVGEQAQRKKLQEVWESVSHDIQQGSGFATALQQHPCFPNFAIRLAEVGERTGNLAEVLDRAAETMRHRRTARESFISATIYPLLVVALSLLVTAYMIVYLIPRLEIYLASLGRELPVMTQNLVNGSVWLRNHFQWLTIGLCAMVGAFCIVWYSKEGRAAIDRYVLRVPMLNTLIRLSETATFSRGLSMLLKSGITVTDGLAATEKTLGNFHLRDVVRSAREMLIRGSRLADSLNQGNSFTPLLHQMVTVGEKSGDLAGVLDEVSIMSDQQFAATVKRLNAIVTPLLTLGIGAVVGYVYIAFFMALVAAGS